MHNYIQKTQQTELIERNYVITVILKLFGAGNPFYLRIYLMDWIEIKWNGGACGVMVIVVRNGHSDTNSNPGWDWLHFT